MLSPTIPKRTAIFICKASEKRKRLGLSVKSVADHLGMSDTSMKDIEDGYGVTLEYALKIAAFYGCRVEELWEAIGSLQPNRKRKKM